MAIQLITEAVACGARSHKACGVLGISCRTLRRWSEASHELSDRRGQAARGRIHPQALTLEEKQAIVQVCNTPEHASLPPSQIVPRLADQGQYLASESSFYRVLKEHGQVNRRGKHSCPKRWLCPKRGWPMGPTKFGAGTSRTCRARCGGSSCACIWCWTCSAR